MVDVTFNIRDQTIHSHVYPLISCYVLLFFIFIAFIGQQHCTVVIIVDNLSVARLTYSTQIIFTSRT